ncbi:MAG: hypothetical protein ABSF61_06605 [Anaerolineales bacterium]|jgi:hypothetical protein
MRVILFVAADWANVTNDQKLNVMGIFNEIRAIKFPTRVPSMHLVVKLVPELGESGQTRNLTVKLRDPDGNDMMAASAEIPVPEPQGGARPEINFILGLKDLVFPKAGPYQFVAMIDKDFKGDLPIYIREVEAPQPAEGAKG